MHDTMKHTQKKNRNQITHTNTNKPCAHMFHIQSEKMQLTVSLEQSRETATLAFCYFSTQIKTSHKKMHRTLLEVRYQKKL